MATPETNINPEQIRDERLQQRTHSVGEIVEFLSRCYEDPSQMKANVEDISQADTADGALVAFDHNMGVIRSFTNAMRSLEDYTSFSGRLDKQSGEYDEANHTTLAKLCHESDVDGIKEDWGKALALINENVQSSTAKLSWIKRIVFRGGQNMPDSPLDLSFKDMFEKHGRDGLKAAVGANMGFWVDGKDSSTRYGFYHLIEEIGKYNPVQPVSQGLTTTAPAM